MFIYELINLIMSKIEKFEDLKCWQSARELVKFVFILCQNGKLAKEFELKGQLKAATLSSKNNIAEGFSRFHKKDTIRFYDISQSSAAEVRSMSYTIEDMNLLEINSIIKLRDIVLKTQNLTLALIKYLNKNLNT